jgi:hypothetical protein
MLAVAIPVGLRAEQSPETVALHGEIGGAHTFAFAFASRPQGSHVRKFVSKVQIKNPNLPLRHRGTEDGFATTDAHG